jgi:hypothetical protein
MRPWNVGVCSGATRPKFTKHDWRATDSFGAEQNHWSGEFGTVWRVSDRWLGEDVALKVSRSPLEVKVLRNIPGGGAGPGSYARGHRGQNSCANRGRALMISSSVRRERTSSFDPNVAAGMASGVTRSGSVNVVCDQFPGIGAEQGKTPHRPWPCHYLGKLLYHCGAGKESRASLCSMT